jgi:tRNA(adenine34) deaminase
MSWNGCVIVRDEQVIGEACNEVDLRHDATPHAEILGMGQAGARLNCNELTDAVLYTTLQPRGMCTMASFGPKSAVLSTERAVTMCMRCISRIGHLDTVDFIRDAYKDDLSLQGELMAGECAALYVSPGADIPKGQQFNR